MPSGGTWQTEDKVIWGHRASLTEVNGRWCRALSCLPQKLLFFDIIHPWMTLQVMGKACIKSRITEEINKTLALEVHLSTRVMLRFTSRFQAFLASLGSPQKFFSPFLRLPHVWDVSHLSSKSNKEEMTLRKQCYWFFKAQLFIQWCLECDASKITIVLIAPWLSLPQAPLCVFLPSDGYTTLMGQIWWSGSLLIYPCKWYTHSQI